jgi:NADH:ubiquinone oxidoreductase subunit 5 (subunit L)/multisubunit Na+/H+ antiporter MnhA subunit
MHRDEGFKRFFNTIIFFALGYNLIIFSGNFETLFIGWEIIGLSSFLLIAFYRNRYLPVKNAFKVLSNYRLSDVAIILAMWMMHNLTHQNINFGQLGEARDISLQSGSGTMAIFIVVMILLAATIKSAQFPFTSWLPRAMEGPTTSSAIFYGSLSVHIGVFVLLRTYPFWQDMFWVKILVIAVGLITGVVATLVARVQPTVKTQIAYSSAAQIGIIFIEVALGFHILALAHFAGNAFLRTYQLLVSPSVLNYLVHHQYFHYHPPTDKPVSKWRAAIYMLGIKEWNLDTVMRKILWDPFKWIGKQMQFMDSPLSLVIFALLGIAAFILTAFYPSLITGDLNLPASGLFLAIALAIVLGSFSYRQSAITAWTWLPVAHLFIIAGLNLNAIHINGVEILLYASGIAVSFALGYYCLQKTQSVDHDISLNHYHGYVYEQKMTAILFLLACIGMIGFPVTAAFIGIDVFFTYLKGDQYVLITLLAIAFIFVELAAFRIFLRIYLGQHKKLNHPVAFRTS